MIAQSDGTSVELPALSEIGPCSLCGRPTHRYGTGGTPWCEECQHLRDHGCVCSPLQRQRLGHAPGCPTQDTATSQPDETDAHVADLDGVRGHWRDYLRLRAERDRLDEAIALLRSIFEVELGDAAEGCIDGQPVVRYAWRTSTRLDQKKFKEAHPELHAQFCREQAVRYFEVVTP